MTETLVDALSDHTRRTAPTSIGAANHTLSHDIPWNILEWLVRIAGPFPRHLQHPLADDVPLDLIGTASNRGSWHRDQDLRQQSFIGVSSPVSSASVPSTEV